MPYQILCNGVKREYVSTCPDQASRLFCSVPLHKIRYGVLGMALVVLMILNVALASIKHTLPMIPDGVFVGIETILLIARAIVAVLFGHAIHALREEYSDSTITIKDANELRQRMEELSSELSRVQQNFQRQLSAELSTMRENFQRTTVALRKGGIVPGIFLGNIPGAGKLGTICTDFEVSRRKSA
jgi:hypothetical protein